MSAIPTTFQPMAYSSRDRDVMPYLHPREIDSVLDALDDGRLVAVTDSGEIVAVATPDLADEIVKRDDSTVKMLRHELKTALKELSSLATIIGEVMAESRPQDFDYRLHDAAEDVRRALSGAIDASEDL
jgi:hypothetical protein